MSDLYCILKKNVKKTHATCLKDIQEVQQKKVREKKRKLKQLKLQPKWPLYSANV